MSGKPDTGLSSDTGGVKSFEIAGRMFNRRERLYYPMTNEERQWRAQFLKDQILEHGETEENFNFDKEFRFQTRNVIRRIYLAPLNFVEEKIFGTRMHPIWAKACRNLIGKGALAFTSIYTLYYYMKYNGHQWEQSWGVDSYLHRNRVYPDEPGWGKTPELTKEEFYDRGFSKSVLYPKEK